LINILNGAASYDLNGDGVVNSADRSTYVGGGIPSEVVTVIREGGTTTLTGTKSGDDVSNLNRLKTYFYQ
jgi:hypothetical protein